eukprot:m.13489 g.13489  ORF g.13489 m.13489 type:complete len:1363 (+) comp4577_c0_seq1:183-4271(+)
MSNVTVAPLSHDGDDGLEPEYAVLFVFSGLFLGAATRHLTDAFRIPVPYTVILLVLGCIIGAVASTGFGVYGDAVLLVSDIDPRLFLSIFLPMLLFESAFSLSWHTFKHSLGHALLLAIPGLIIAAGLSGVVVKLILQTDWSWSESFMLGSLLSATDPVAVVALLRDLGASPKLGTLIEGESLLNDGTAIVLFDVFSEIVRGDEPSGGDVVKTLAQLSLGGPVLGLVWAAVTIGWISRVVNDPFVEITITFCSAYLLFFVAESILHVSGVLALVVLGGSFAAFGRTQISVHVEDALHQFWATITYHGNTLVFLLAGVIMAQRISFDTFDGADYGYVILLWVCLMLIRIVVVIILWPLLRSTRFGYKLSPKGACVLIWGALRGAVSLALALIVALDVDEIREDVRDFVLFYASGIAFLTLTINASTTGLLLRFLQMSKPSDLQLDIFPVNLRRLDRISKREMETLAKDKIFTGCNWKAVEERIFTNRHFEAVTHYLGGQNPYAEEQASANQARNPFSLMAAGTSVLGATGTANNGGLGLAVAAADDALQQDPEAALDDNSVQQPVGCFRRTLHKMHRWFNEHDEHETSRLAEAKKDARERFLNSTKSIYWQRFHDGYLPGSAVPILMQAAERAEDSSNKPLNEWSDTLQSFTRVAEALVKANCRGGAKALSLAINVASNFVHAQDRALKLLIDSLYNLNINGVDDDVARILTLESKANVRRAHGFMTKAREEYPNIYVATQSRLAASLLLEHRNRFIDKFSKYGLFTTREAEILRNSVRHAEKELQLHDQPIPPPDARSIVRRSWLFAGVKDDVFDSCWGISEKKIYPEPGSIVMERGCSVNIGIHCVVRGTAMFQTRARPEPDLLPAGTLFGVTETLSFIPGLLGVTAHSNLETVFFEADRFRTVLRSLPENSRLRHNFLTLATFQLVYMNWPELYRTTHPDVTRVPPPDKVLIQTELTKDFLQTEFEEMQVFHLYYPSLLVRGAVAPLSNAGVLNEAVSVLAPNHSYRVATPCYVIQFPHMATNGAQVMPPGGNVPGGGGQPMMHLPTEDFHEHELDDLSDSDQEPEWAELHRETSAGPNSPGSGVGSGGQHNHHPQQQRRRSMTAGSATGAITPPLESRGSHLTVPSDSHTTRTPGSRTARVTMNTGAKSFHNDFDGLMDIFEDNSHPETGRRRAVSMGSNSSTSPPIMRRPRAVSYATAMLPPASSDSGSEGSIGGGDTVHFADRHASDGVNTEERIELFEHARAKARRKPRNRTASAGDERMTAGGASRTKGLSFAATAGGQSADGRPLPKQVSKLKANGAGGDFVIQGVTALTPAEPPSPNSPLRRHATPRTLTPPTLIIDPGDDNDDGDQRVETEL